eukprot:3173388-Prymnesium_polylepis.1
MGRRMLAADVGWRGGDPRGGGGAPQSSQVHALSRDLRAGARASHSHQARGAGKHASTAGKHSRARAPTAPRVVARAAPRV